ncbi:MAG: hypothetical protein IPO40_19340 [Fibrobacteres bacterium]|nr:hypothetical protein [Fibrobacterota bacterium]
MVKIEGIQVAVVSGRPISSMRGFCRGIEGIWMVGDHGRSAISPDGREIADWDRGSVPEQLDRMEQDAREIALCHPGAAVERKTFGVSLHVRNVPTDLRKAALVAVSEWKSDALSFGLEALDGREVVEVQSPGGGKLVALEKLQALTGSDFVIFGGDDTTDLIAIESLTSRIDGMGVWVRSSERSTPEQEPSLIVDGPVGWAEFLEELARQLKESR